MTIKEKEEKIFDLISKKNEIEILIVNYFVRLDRFLEFTFLCFVPEEALYRSSLLFTGFLLTYESWGNQSLFDSRLIDADYC